MFKKKFNAEDKVEKCKDYLVAKGYSKVEGTGFSEIFSLTNKLTSIIIILSIIVD